MLKEIMPHKLNDIRPLKHKVVSVSVTNDRKQILGYLNISFYIGTIQFTHRFSVVDEISEDMIIGRDFLFKFNCRLDFGTKTLIANPDHRVLALSQCLRRLPSKALVTLPV